LAQLRNEIESMEAEQKTLEHRVDFATIELKMHTDLPLSQSAPFSFFGMRMGKALSAGYQNAAGSLMGLLLFLAEYGPAILIWVVLLGLPGFFVWRRYRRVRSRI